MEAEYKPKLMFIDFEFATYNPRGFDLADHFAKYAYDYSASTPPFTNVEKLANSQHMMKFMVAYVDEWQPNLNEDEKQKEAERLLEVSNNKRA